MTDTSATRARRAGASAKSRRPCTPGVRDRLSCKSARRLSGAWVSTSSSTAPLPNSLRHTGQHGGNDDGAAGRPSQSQDCAAPTPTKATTEDSAWVRWCHAFGNDHARGFALAPPPLCSENRISFCHDGQRNHCQRPHARRAICTRQQSQGGIPCNAQAGQGQHRRQARVASVSNRPWP